MDRRAQGRRGFTLIELVVVIALLAILFSVMAPPFFRSLGWARMSGSARALVSMAKFARFHAIMHGRPVFLAIDMVDNRFSLGADPPEGVVFAWMAGGDASWGDDSGYRWGGADGLGDPWDPVPVAAGDGYGGDPDAGNGSGFLSGLAAIPPYDVPSQVRLDTFTFAESERLDADRAAVVFLPDGTCQEFTLILEDHRGRRLEVWFDPLTGQPEVYPPRESS